MSTTTLSRPQKVRVKAKPKVQQRESLRLPHTPQYITIHPPGDELFDKMEEMGIDAAELAKRMGVSLETVQKLFKWDIPLTRNLAEKIELATQIPANLMMQFEARALKKWTEAIEHPEKPAYWNGEIVNQCE
ncbi:MAG: hypothetical protein LBT46_00230 [Planctomycetaceae bacterium]|jgi:plasmid maintenance system antidote protein VapI|nr:hypothetical protein [Planctomycetaceae bacterium]